MQGNGAVWQAYHLQKVSKVIVTPINFLTCFLSLFWWKPRGKINFILMLNLPFLSGRPIFSPWWTICHVSIYCFSWHWAAWAALLTSTEVFCSLLHSLFQYFLFMLVSIFSEARRFCLRKPNPLKVLYNYLHYYLKCLPWCCSELRGVDRQPTVYWCLHFFLWGGGMEFWRLSASSSMDQAIILCLWRDVYAWRWAFQQCC